MKYNHALVLNPYVKESSAAMGFFPPTGLEYVATAMEGLVGRVSLVDMRQEPDLQNPESLIRFIESENVDLICISCNWSYYFKNVIAIINHMPKEIDLIVGGQQATDYVEELFEWCPNIGIIVRGEGEEPMQDILLDKDLGDIKGISFRSNGRIVHNPTRELAPIESLKYPNRKLRRSKYYLKNKNVVLSESGFDTILTARGCPYNCKFCTISINPLGQKRSYAARSAESIVEELKTTDARVIFMADDNFFVDHRRITRICDLIIQEKINKRFVAHARLEVAKHPKMLERAYEAGFRVMLMGIESPHDKILKQFNKGFTRKDIEESFAVLRSFPFYYHAYFIFGNIDETRDEMLYIPEFADRIGVDSISAMKLRLEKYSAMKDMIEKTPGYHYNTTGFVYSDTYDIDELGRIGKKIKKQFYTPSRLVKIFKKLKTTEIFTKEDLWRFLTRRLPLLIPRLLAREVEKKTGRTRKKLRRMLPAPKDELSKINIRKKL